MLPGASLFGWQVVVLGWVERDAPCRVLVVEALTLQAMRAQEL
jgi:hypothetical protein